jgi:hypothetical protein
MVTMEYDSFIEQIHREIEEMIEKEEQRSKVRGPKYDT